MWGFVAIAVFMIAYYLLFGVVSVLALSANLLLLVALLSLLQATLTLPGIAAIALTLGMAIDANVLINERIREELRNGSHAAGALSRPATSAPSGTILDSNITTLIAGLALLIFGSGPVRGFAVVHCLGILTSIFSVGGGVARAGQPDLRPPARSWQSVAIGQIWKPGTVAATVRNKENGHGIFPHRKDIPFMRHALVFNIISLITFLLAVFFLFAQGPAPVGRVHRRYADRGQLQPGRRPREDPRRARHVRLQRYSVQNFGSSRTC